MTSPAIQKVFEDGLRSAIPDGGQSVSQWAETYRYVSEERSARAGRWSNDLVPFLVEIMDSFSDPTVYEIVFQKSSQVAGTEFIINCIGSRMHLDPGPMMYMAEQESKARAFTEEALDPTISATPVLRERVFDHGLKSSNNNQQVKRFVGGRLNIVWATSPAQLSSRPVRDLYCDEVDAFEPTSEGDPIKLAEARQKTFNETKKRVLVSSPRNKETSTIEPRYLAGDQRQYFVPCPQCGEFQTLKWSNVRWDDEPSEAFYLCEKTGCFIENEEKFDMLAKGKWIAAEAFKGIASFKINEIYSPFTNWGDMAVDFLEAKKHPETLKVFVNTRLGETWEEAGEQIEYADLKFKQEEYLSPVPHGVLVLTAGVDVQDDRLECEVIGWGKDLESWSIDYAVIWGSPALPDVWDDLSDYLTQHFEGESGAFRIAAACIDSGGHHTSQVYRFSKANFGRRWFAVKGANVSGKPLISKPSIVGTNKVKLWTVGTDTAKDEIFSFLKVAEAGSPGFCHFPAGDKYDEKYFKQLCAEKKITKYIQGVARQVWVKVSESARNEALDVRVYAMAARAILNPNLEKIAKRRLNFPEVADRLTDEVSNEQPVENAVEKPANNNKKKRFVVKNNPFS
jgi:phage terminase large subunit GpA-like protein